MTNRIVSTARALKFLRQRNLIHRDIKPQNLLLCPPGNDDLGRGHPLGIPLLKVADFGFARSLPNAMMAETLCGSP
jgi:serine/threonine-protein kinase ULK/ATG1